MTELEKVSHETMIFMRGKYRLDEIGDGKDELKFKQGQKTILTIYTHEDRFTFLIKKKPNRKPFPKENAIHGQCGHRCDLCIHFTGMSEELRSEIEPRLTRVWDIDDWSMRCGGCLSKNCYCQDDLCDPKRCAADKGLQACRDCDEYPCINATVADNTSMIHTNIIMAEDITWGILPYVPMQYEEV